MRKALFMLLACCLTTCTAFAQFTQEIQLNEGKPQCEIPIDLNGDEQGRFFIKVNGEPDDQGRTPVQIELENSSNNYDFLLFDHTWSKKELRKQKIHLDKGYTGESTLAVENIELDVNQGYLIPSNSGKRYIFPVVLVEEEKTYECKIPIHLAKPKPNWFCKKKKKLYDIITYPLQITVDIKDKAYEKLEHSCDSLTKAFYEDVERKVFCTNQRHRPGFEDQVLKYTCEEQNLRNQINRQLADKTLSTHSKKYKRYTALLDSLDKMNQAKNNYEHDCGRHKVTNPSCGYCSLSLQEIYNRLNRHYINLYNGEVQKTAIINEVNALYRCGTTHSNAKRTNGDSYKARIIEFYNKIKKY